MLAIPSDGGIPPDVLGLYALLLLGIVAALCAGPTGTPSRDGAPREIDMRVFAPLAAALVFVTFWHEHLIATAADLQRTLPAWMARLPAVPVMDLRPLYGHIDRRISMAVEVLSLLESGLLVALVVVSRQRSFGWRVMTTTAVAVGALVGVVVSSHGLLSQDVYAYIADGVLGPAAYRPTDAPFIGALHPIIKLWGSPPIPCTYGPTWLMPATLLMHGVHDVADGVLRFRLAGVASILAVGVCLKRGRAPLPVLLAFVLNPMIWMHYAADAHNDLWPLACILWGRLQKDRPLVASFFGGLAGAAKLPFLAVCLLTGADRKHARERWLIAAGSLSFAVLFSVLFGGRPYLAAIETVQHAYTTPTDPVSLGAHMMALVGTIAALVGAVVLGRTAWPAAFSFIGMGYAIFPWYAAWGFAYATLGAGAEYLLCALPLSAFVTATTYSVTPLWLPLLVAVAVTACVYAYRLARLRFTRDAQRPPARPLAAAR